MCTKSNYIEWDNKKWNNLPDWKEWNHKLMPPYIPNTTMYPPNGPIEEWYTTTTTNPYQIDIKPSFTGVYINEIHFEWSLLRRMGTKAAILWAILSQEYQIPSNYGSWSGGLKNYKKYFSNQLITTTNQTTFMKELNENSSSS
jgi:hypothetical protein